MRKIWKYELKVIDDIQHLQMPFNGRIVNVAMQGQSICMWVEFNSDNEKENRYFRVFGTGHPIESLQYEYRGTCLDNNLTLVWHVYEVFGQDVIDILREQKSG